ncbi:MULTISPECIES: PAAR domain-containing protein [Burkholderia]|uniref:PAAR domain-containing protein n=2 Tax=Burkholderia TaxID=32008 RepID=A0A365QV98_9BURK|nr:MULTISPECIES: PAAR domain-containing protein [Burkholderia]MBE2971684.1 PAAR domain-containing protein [Burkholderia cepacia]MCA8351988.1 PAAR domain-containing protein [Burkholderia cepacia]NHB08623.1 PAAR domain-containing protein [Burkholderia cepacia]RBB39183.1 PAAR domain-containing protein [Burkholderia reimsis]UQO32900.1 PAAR domain-containing protein [Burkholderia cepacia]
MTRSLIVLGNTSTHGGAVQTATTGLMVNGIPVAGHGDILQCPMHGPVALQASGSGMQSNGKAPIRDGDTAACGATLIASRSRVTWAG